MLVFSPCIFVLRSLNHPSCKQRIIQQRLVYMNNLQDESLHNISYSTKDLLYSSKDVSLEVKAKVTEYRPMFMSRHKNGGQNHKQWKS